MNIKRIGFILFAVVTLSWTSCDTLNSISNGMGTTSGVLSESDIISGLKEALQVGTSNASGMLNKTDGYFKDPLVKILFPADAQRAADKLRQLGMGQMVDDFTLNMNRAAESAAKEAAPIFVDAIKSMTFADARNILNGPDNAATEFFKGKTTPALVAKFSPVISKALDSHNVTKYWSDITTTYNRIPLVTKVETDLVSYTTGKALNGLFLKLEGEEKEIRNNPAARVTGLLQKVFGSVKK